MITVSEKYKALATDNGREIFCIITAGDMTFNDKQIVSFQFNDIVHPEDMSFGTACANRFHFEVLTEDFIPLSAVVKPYVYFEGSDEPCPLGEFYIARRYRKKGFYSITCYDKMYRLDGQFKTDLKSPITAQALLSEICAKFEIAADFICENYSCENIPEGISYRDALGYIAALHGGNIKFSRDGKLTLKTLEHCGETITRKNYVSCSLKADILEVKAFEVIADGKLYKAGESTRLNTYRVQTPFGNDAVAKKLLSKWQDFAYYGMELEMQGLPYLEAGDSISVQSDSDSSVYPAIISENALYYDGTLRGVLTSRSKNPIDEYEEPSGDEQQITNIYNELAIAFYTYTNDKVITCESVRSKLFDITFDAIRETGVIFNAQLVVTASENLTLKIFYRINMGTLAMMPIFTLKANEPQAIPLHTFVNGVVSGTNFLTIQGITSGGSIRIEKEQAVASIIGQFLKAGTLFVSPNRTLSETFPLYTSNLSLPVLFSGFGENFQPRFDARTIKEFSSSFGVFTANTMPAPINFAGYRALEFNGAISPTVTRESFTRLKLVFKNPITSENSSANISAFTILAAAGLVITNIPILSLEFPDDKTVYLNTASFESAINGITISYDNINGNFYDCHMVDQMDSFIVEFSIF